MLEGMEEKGGWMLFGDVEGGGEYGGYMEGLLGEENMRIEMSESEGEDLKDRVDLMCFSY